MHGILKSVLALEMACYWAQLAVAAHQTNDPPGVSYNHQVAGD